MRKNTAIMNHSKTVEKINKPNHINYFSTNLYVYIP